MTHPVETLVAKHRRLIGWLGPLSSVEPQRAPHLLGTLSLKTNGRARITAALERTDPKSWSVMEMEIVLR